MTPAIQTSYSYTPAAGDTSLATSLAASSRSLMVWRFDVPVECLSSAPVGGGRSTVDWMLNATVAADFDHLDLTAFVDSVAEGEALKGTGVGFLTAADVARAETVENDGVLVEASVGVTRPTWAADIDGSHNTWRPGTINIVAQCPAPLSEAAAVNAIITITEAKTQALFEAGVPGTGTASDAVAVLWPSEASHAEIAEFGGPRSTWGARIARATHQAIVQGLRSHP